MEKLEKISDEILKKLKEITPLNNQTKILFTEEEFILMLENGEMEFEGEIISTTIKLHNKATNRTHELLNDEVNEKNVTELMQLFSTVIRIKKIFDKNNVQMPMGRTLGTAQYIDKLFNEKQSIARYHTMIDYYDQFICHVIYLQDTECLEFFSKRINFYITQIFPKPHLAANSIIIKFNLCFLKFFIVKHSENNTTALKMVAMLANIPHLGNKTEKNFLLQQAQQEDIDIIKKLEICLEFVKTLPEHPQFQEVMLHLIPVLFHLCSRNSHHKEYATRTIRYIQAWLTSAKENKDPSQFTNAACAFISEMPNETLLTMEDGELIIILDEGMPFLKEKTFNNLPSMKGKNYESNADNLLIKNTLESARFCQGNGADSKAIYCYIYCLKYLSISKYNEIISGKKLLQELNDHVKKSSEKMRSSQPAALKKLLFAVIYVLSEQQYFLSVLDHYHTWISLENNPDELLAIATSLLETCKAIDKKHSNTLPGEMPQKISTIAYSLVQSILKNQVMDWKPHANTVIRLFEIAIDADEKNISLQKEFTLKKLELARWYKQNDELEKAYSLYDAVLDKLDNLHSDGENISIKDILKEAAECYVQLANQYACKTDELYLLKALHLYQQAAELYISIQATDQSQLIAQKKIPLLSQLAEKYQTQNKLKRAIFFYETILEELEELQPEYKQNFPVDEFKKKLQKTKDQWELEKKQLEELMSRNVNEEKQRQQELQKKLFSPKEEQTPSEKKKKKRSQSQSSSPIKQEKKPSTTPINNNHNQVTFFKGNKVGTPIHGKFLKEETSTLYPVFDKNSSDIKRLKRKNFLLYHEFKMLARDGRIGRDRGQEGFKHIGFWELKSFWGSGIHRCTGHIETDNGKTYLIIDTYVPKGFHNN